MGKSSGGGSETVQETSSPPPQVLKNYQQVFSEAQAQAQQPLAQYSAPLVAGFTNDQLAAMQGIDTSQGIANPFINSAAQLTAQGATPISYSPIGASQINQYMSPYTQDVVNATQAQFNNQNQQQQQQLIGNAISSGAWGGDRAAVAQGILGGQQQLAQAPVIAGLYNQNYSQALGESNEQQQTGIGAQEASGWLGENAAYGMGALGTEAQNTALQGASSQLQSGALQQQLAQEELNVPYEQFTQAQAYPYQNIGWLSNIAMGLGSQSGGTSSTTSPGPSLLGQLGGLGLSGLGLYNSGALSGLIGGGSSALGPYGAAGLDVADLAIPTAAASDAGLASAADFMAAMFKRGGRVGRDTGGPTPGFALPSVPDVSVSVLPDSQQQALRGKGPPNAPPPMQQPDSTQQLMSEIQMAGGLKNILKPSPNAGFGDGGHIHRAAGGLAGYTTAPGRNIAVPVLNVNGTNPMASAPGFTPANATTPTLDINPTSNFTPPSVGSTPVTPITYPILQGGTGSPVVGSPTTFGALPSVSSTTAAKNTSPSTPSSAQEALLNAIHQTGGALYADGGAVGPEDALQGFALGGAGPAGFDDGGAVGASAGFTPGAFGGNPMQANMYQQFSQLPPEKLQELSVRFPPSSPQGAMIHRALQVKQMSGAQGPLQQPQGLSGFAQTPSTPSAPIGATMARGGRMHRDDGGLVGDPTQGQAGPAVSGFLGDVGDALHQVGEAERGALRYLFQPDPNAPIPTGTGGVYYPPTGTPSPSPQTATVLPTDTGPNLGIGATANAPVPAGLMSPPERPVLAGASPSLAFSPEPPPAGARGVTPGFVPPSTQDYPPQSTAPEPMPPQAFVPRPAVYEPPAPNPMQRPLSPSPMATWELATGLGMLASRSPFPGVALGQGGLQGLKAVQEQQELGNRQQETAGTQAYHKAEIEDRAQQLLQQADIENKRIGVETKREQDLQDRYNREAYVPSPGYDENGNFGTWYQPKFANPNGIMPEAFFRPQVTVPKSGASATDNYYRQEAARLYPNDPDKQQAWVEQQRHPGFGRLTENQISQQVSREFNNLRQAGQPPDNPAEWMAKRTAELRAQNSHAGQQSSPANAPPVWTKSATGPGGVKIYSNDGRSWFNANGTPYTQPSP